MIVASPRAPLALEFWVDGQPVPWKRPAGGKSTRRFNPPTMTAWEDKINLIARRSMAKFEQIKTSAPIKLDCTFVFPIAESWIKKGSYSAEGRRHLWTNRAGETDIYYTKDPDASNLLKCVEDALIGVCYDDDNQCDSSVRRRFGHSPGVLISVMTP